MSYAFNRTAGTTPINDRFIQVALMLFNLQNIVGLFETMELQVRSISKSVEASKQIKVIVCRVRTIWHDGKGLGSGLVIYL